MESNKRKSRVVEDIDEAALLQSVYEQSNPPAVPVAPKEKEQEKPLEPAPEPEPPKEVKETKEPVRRKRNNTDYGSQFLQRNELKARSCVYISQKIHTAISRIVKVLSDRDITVGGYIDCILTEHLETHRDEIIELYNRELSKNDSKSLMDF